MYIACNVKYLRIDEFSSMRFDAIKPKLFENQRPDELDNDDVPPIAIRIDFPKGQSPSPPPLVTFRMQNRSLQTTSHALDILSQNLEEIFTDEEKLERQKQPPKYPPIDLHLNNIQITLKFLEEHFPTQGLVESKPPVNMNIECLHVLRDDRNQSTSNPPEQNSEEFERLRNENARLRAELDGQKKEIIVLSGERDSLMQAISKLDLELTEAEYQRQQQIPQEKMIISLL